MIYRFQMIVGHAIACTSRKYTGFGTTVLLVEINDIFRYLGRLSRATQFDRSNKLLYGIFLALSLLTNVVCRFFVMIWLFYFVLRQWGTASTFQFLVGSIGIVYAFHLAADMFRRTWNKLVIARENACFNNVNGHHVTSEKKMSSENQAT